MKMFILFMSLISLWGCTQSDHEFTDPIYVKDSPLLLNQEKNPTSRMPSYYTNPMSGLPMGSHCPIPGGGFTPVGMGMMAYQNACNFTSPPSPGMGFGVAQSLSNLFGGTLGGSSFNGGGSTYSNYMPTARYSTRSRSKGSSESKWWNPFSWGKGSKSSRSKKRKSNRSKNRSRGSRRSERTSQSSQSQKNTSPSTTQSKQNQSETPDQAQSGTSGQSEGEDKAQGQGSSDKEQSTNEAPQPEAITPPAQTDIPEKNGNENKYEETEDQTSPPRQPTGPENLCQPRDFKNDNGTAEAKAGCSDDCASDAPPTPALAPINVCALDQNSRVLFLNAPKPGDAAESADYKCIQAAQKRTASASYIKHEMCDCSDDAKKPCVNEDYTNAIYNAIDEVSECTGVPPKEMFSNFNFESGYHVTAKHTNGGYPSSGIAQLLVRKDDNGNIQGLLGDIYQKSNDGGKLLKDGCNNKYKKYIKTSTLNKYVDSSVDSNNTCAFTTVKHNPEANALYGALAVQFSKDYVDHYLEQEKPKGIEKCNLNALDNATKDAIRKSLPIATYNWGPGNAVGALCKYLQSKDGSVKASDFALKSKATGFWKFVESEESGLKGIQKTYMKKVIENLKDTEKNAKGNQCSTLSV